ncbi:MAG: iron-containing alcohol dehydrogenase [Moraxellaceae bacterium]|nr:iron-containing alcohol dehydrogenase [Moraxellaceae bacterium]
MMVSCIGDKRSRLIFPINVSFGTDWQLSLHKSILNLCIDNEKLNIYIVVSPSQHTTASLAILDDDIAKIAAITIGVFSCCDDASITQLDAECASNDTDVLIALGGGNVIDLCKLVSLREVYLIAVPSILSSDCVSSPIAVKKKRVAFVTAFQLQHHMKLSLMLNCFRLHLIDL